MCVLLTMRLYFRQRQGPATYREHLQLFSTYESSRSAQFCSAETMVKSGGTRGGGYRGTLGSILGEAVGDSVILAGDIPEPDEDVVFGFGGSDLFIGLQEGQAGRRRFVASSLVRIYLGLS